MEDQALSDKRNELPQGPLWPALERLRIGLGIYLTLLALTVMPWNEQALLAFFIFFTVGFIVTNLVGLRGGRERRCVVEFGAMLFGLGQIICLVVATGGAKGPLLFLFCWVFPLLRKVHAASRLAFLSLRFLPVMS